jgi:hypothetical protein
MSDQYEEQNTDSSGQDQTEGGTGGGEGGAEENNEADMIFAPEASKPGRNAGMLMVAFVLIGVGVIYFMRTRGGPSTAVANPDAIKADTSIKEFIRDGNQIKKMKSLLDDTQKMVDQFSKDRTSAADDKKLDHNPWVFVPPNAKPIKTGDPNVPHDKAQAQFLEGVNNLRVQYLMVSPFAKTAMINNKLLQEGQEIDGYNVEKITPTEVFFSKTINGFTFKAGVKTGKELK